MLATIRSNASLEIHEKEILLHRNASISSNPYPGCYKPSYKLWSYRSGPDMPVVVDNSGPLLGCTLAIHGWSGRMGMFGSVAE